MAGKDVTFDPDFIGKFLFVRELMMHMKTHLLQTNLDYDAAIEYLTRVNESQENEMAKEVNVQILEALALAKELHGKLAASNLQPATFDQMVEADEGTMQ